VAGTHGIGVRTPKAAAVAAALRIRGRTAHAEGMILVIEYDP